MGSILGTLQPTALWNYFEDICGIPHPSKQEQMIADHVIVWAEGRGLYAQKDEVGNVIIRKPASPGMENKKGVILQAHLDMVPQKNSDTVHDFEKDPITPWIDGEWVRAKGTTLGADDGIGVAAVMAILEMDIPFGPIEVLLTIDEETGLTGAEGLKPGLLNGEILLNLDSEDEGEVCVGCAGGMAIIASIPYGKDKIIDEDSCAFEVSLKGLKGGHSAVDINLGRGNAIKLIARFVKFTEAQNLQLQLGAITGGTLHNAIPREASVTVVCNSKEDAEKLAVVISDFEKIIKGELTMAEPEISLISKACDLPKTAIDSYSQGNIIDAIYGCPNGVARMIDALSGSVETSSNLGVVKMLNDNVVITCLVRSSVDSSRDDFAAQIISVLKLAGAEIKLPGGFSSWQPNFDSPILNLMKDLYQKRFDGESLKVTVTHGGLECGSFLNTYKNWEMVSFGPTIKSPHSPDERVNIQSVQKFWDLLIDVLVNIPEK